MEYSCLMEYWYEYIKALVLTVQKYQQGKCFQKVGQLQGQGYIVKNVGTHEKVLPLEMLIWNIKALGLTVQKLSARL